MSKIQHLSCSRCGKNWPPGRLYNLCPECSSPLLVHYDLESIGHHFKKTELLDRPADMWRYMEALPAETEEDIISLGEGFTPLVHLENLGNTHGYPHLYIKNEACNPTGSFKDRGLSAAVTMAHKLGAQRLCIPTAGNAGGALASYAARAGLEAHIFMPRDTPVANIVEARVAGARVTLVDGLISDAGKEMALHKEREGWFDVSTLKEPYRIEGKKTMGYELAEQFQWILPDLILYPTGGGTGLIGMWKAFEEMGRLGWIGTERPRMVAVQSEGCAPIVRAFDAGGEESEFWEGARTFASGIRVPKAIGDFLILRDVRESNGLAVAVSDEQIYRSISDVGAAEGIFLCPEGAACWAAFLQMVEKGLVDASEKVVLFNTGSGHKYLESVSEWLRIKNGG